MKRFFAIAAFIAGGLGAELASPFHCNLIHSRASSNNAGNNNMPRKRQRAE